MQDHSRTRQQLYARFIEFVRHESQTERSMVNRRMLSVFLWCFILPVAATVTILILASAGVIPRSVRRYQDWLILVFPVSYSIYFLSSQVLKDLPRNLSRGGLSGVLNQAERDSEWRLRVSEGMSRSVDADADEWRWIVTNFRMDLQAVQYRVRYLTALAGAVFFLLTQGIDSISGPAVSVTAIGPETALAWMQSIQDGFTQFVGLGRFLVLLVLSGSQNYHALQRYRDCAELVLEEKIAPRKNK